MRTLLRNATIITALLVAFCGCTRKYYRNFADRDVYRIEAERDLDWRWRVPQRAVEADPNSRIGDVNDPNHYPLIPDDPASRNFQVSAISPFEFHGWKKRGTAQIENLKWMDSIPRDSDGQVKLDVPMAMTLALKNNRDYQTQVENVYLQALSLTLSRFQFFPQFFGNQSTQYRNFGANKNASTQLQLLTTDGVNWTFYTGANLVVNFANSLVFEYSGKGFQTVTSGLSYSFTQPLLQGAWARNFTQPLSLVERATLYTVRIFAHYRRTFYTSTVTSYLQLLSQLQQIRNQQNQIDSAKRNLDEYNALVQAGIYNPIDRDVAAQTYQVARNSMLGLEASYQTQLDLYRIGSLGLPADFPVKVDEKILDQFVLNDPRLDTLRTESDKLYLALLQYEGKPEKPVMAEAAKKLRDQFQQLREVATTLNDELGRWKTQLQERKARDKDGVGLLEDDEKASDQRQGALADVLEKDYKNALTLLDSNIKKVEEYIAKLDTADHEAAWVTLQQDFVGREFRARLSELFVIQTQVRVYLIELKMVDITVEQAISIALANRLDLMNAKGQATDAWRNVEVAGNQLLAGLSVYDNGTLATPPNHLGIFAFSAHQSANVIGLRFDAPINRRAQRNGYRQNQILFQRSRRNYMLVHDQIVQTIRLDMRQLNLARRQFDINREQLLIAARQLDNVEYQARTNVGGNASGSAGLNLANALNNLLSAKNQLIGNWILYESQRIDLFADLDIMNIDVDGVWTNDARIPSFNGQPVPSTPDPVGARDERILPGPAVQPDPVDAGAGDVIGPLSPPPAAGGASPFARP